MTVLTPTLIKEDRKEILDLQILTKEYDQQEEIRNREWYRYEANYEHFYTRLKNAVTEEKFTTKNKKISCLNLSTLGSKLRIDGIKNKITVPEGTRIAQMSCVDEATQAGECTREENLQGELLGTMSDPSVPRYILDIPGSGALNHECKKLQDANLTTEELINLENARLEKLATRVVSWCKSRSIVKFTVTYHCACGAVGKRRNLYPQLCSGDELETARECASNTAKAIAKIAEKNNYSLQITTAFIGDKQMCKCRPLEMHNAVGSIGCLDSSIRADSLDEIAKINFFDVFVYSDFDSEENNQENILEVEHDAVANLKLTVSIATGDHGWGKAHFDSERPYLVLLFVNGDSQKSEAIDIFEQMEESYSKEELDSLSFYIINTNG